MTTRLLLEYPTESAQQRIYNDLVDLVRGFGAPGQGPTISISGDDASEVAYLKTRMAQIRESLGDYTPGGDLPATDAIVSDAETVPLQTNGGVSVGSGTATVAASAVTSVKLPASSAVVTNSGAVSVRNSAGADPHAATAVTTAPGVLTGVNLAATVALVDNSDAIPVLPATGTTPAQGSSTAAVASGVVTGVRLPATSAVVTTGQVIAASGGGNVTLTVAANVVTASYAA